MKRIFSIQIVQFCLHRLTLIFVSFLFLQTSIHAQTNSLSSWNFLSIQYQISPKWSILGETQLRSFQFYQHFNYYQYKSGIQYHFNPTTRLAILIGDYDTYQNDGNFLSPKRNDEQRIYPQGIKTNQRNKWTFEHRVRMEVRFRNNEVLDRYRYRIGFHYLLSSNKHASTTWKLVQSNEVFVVPHTRPIERSRFQLGVEYRIAQKHTFYAGYLYQHEHFVQTIPNRNFFQMAYQVKIEKQRLYKKEEFVVKNRKKSNAINSLLSIN